MSKSIEKEREIRKKIDLCDSKGKLNKDSVGWLRHPLVNCNLSGNYFRKKKWNYWCVTNENCLFSVTISNIDYAGMVFAYFLDFKTNHFVEKTIVTPFGKGCSMPNGVNESVVFDNNKLNIKMISQGKSTRISVKCDDFDGFQMSADFEVIYPSGHETLNVIVPWDDKHFQFTSKHECLPVVGSLKVGANTYRFSPESTFACLDYGRGVWPYKVKWNWANASGIQNGRVIGLNLGGQWTDGTGSTENGLLVDGRISKISEDLKFEYNPNNFMEPWTIKTTKTDRVNLTFTPFYERIAKTDLKLVKSEVHQMIGHFSGTIVTDKGESITLDKLLGCSEDHFGQW